jgi:hypothetical protein
MRPVTPSEIIDGEGVLHVLTTTDTPGEDASPLLDNICFDAPDHFAQAAAINAALQACSLSLASMNDPEDNYVTALPLSYVEDSSVADNTLHIPQGVVFLHVPACTLPSATPLSLRAHIIRHALASFLSDLAKNTSDLIVTRSHEGFT